MVSDKIFFMFLLYKPMYNMWPPVWGHFGPRGMIWTNLVEDHYMMLHIKYQCSRPCGFRQEDFFHAFHHISLCKTCDPQGGAIFGLRGMIWTSLVEVNHVMLHTKYQDSRPYGFRQEELFMFLLYARGVQYVMKTAQYIQKFYIHTLHNIVH